MLVTVVCSTGSQKPSVLLRRPSLHWRTLTLITILNQGAKVCFLKCKVIYLIFSMELLKFAMTRMFGECVFDLLSQAEGRETSLQYCRFHSRMVISLEHVRCLMGSYKYTAMAS